MKQYTVRRSTFTLWFGYFLVEFVLMTLAIAMYMMWKDGYASINWSFAIVSWIMMALFFHGLLFVGTFYRIKIFETTIEYHAFLKRKRTYSFSDIKQVIQSHGMDIKVIGQNNKRLFYIKMTDKNINRFLEDVNAFLEGNANLAK